MKQIKIAKYFRLYKQKNQSTKKTGLETLAMTGLKMGKKDVCPVSSFKYGRGMKCHKE